MAVNREVESLSGLLRDLPYVLKPGGRAAIITFHPGEERLVAAAFAEGRERGTYARAPPSPRDRAAMRSARTRGALGEAPLGRAGRGKTVGRRLFPLTHGWRIEHPGCFAGTLRPARKSLLRKSLLSRVSRP